MGMASFSLTITFIGLVSFVPIEKDGRLETMWVLLPNAVEGKGPCSQVVCGDERPAHHAFLRYPARNLAGAELDDLGNDQFVLTPLFAVDLRITATLDGSRVGDRCAASLEAGPLRRYRSRKVVNGAPAETPTSTSDCDLRDFSWVPDLGRFAKPVANVCDTCLEEPVTPKFPLDRVAARLKLTQGTLLVDSVETIRGGGFAVYKFSNETSTIQQALADQVSLRLEGLTEPVTLVLSSLEDPTAPHRKITLKPSVSGEDVKVQVFNHVPLGILDPDHQHRTGSAPQRIDDFRLYYRLSGALNLDTGDGCREHALPVPERVRSNADSPICPKAQMSPPASK